MVAAMEIGTSDLSRVFVDEIFDFPTLAAAFCVAGLGVVDRSVTLAADAVAKA